MKKNLLSIGAVVACLLGATSCAAPSYITYDAKVPAAWVRPMNVASIALINHTEYSLSNVAADVNHELATRLVEEKDFLEVTVLDSLIENDIQEADVKALTKSMKVDCLVSLDSLDLTFAGREKGQKVPLITWNDVFSSLFDVDSSASASAQLSAVMYIYMPGKPLPYARIDVNDQLGWTASAQFEHEAVDYLPSTEEKIPEIIECIAINLKRQLLPYWKTVSRPLYDSGDKDLKRAKKFVDNNQWDKAADLWREMYRNKDAYRIKALAAHNLFVYYEKISNPDEAIEWCKKGAGYFKRNGSSAEAGYLLKQIPELEKRIEELKRLDQQAAAEL